MIQIFDLREFIRESNRIEGYYHEPTADEFAAHIHLQECDRLTVEDIEKFVWYITCNKEGKHGARLRRLPGMNVMIGGHVPPPGGPHIEEELKKFLDDVNYARGMPMTSYEHHIRYETLHPFSDGNGRSGRAIWWWQNFCDAPIGFLHQFYYDTLRDRQ